MNIKFADEKSHEAFVDALNKDADVPEGERTLGHCLLGLLRWTGDSTATSPWTEPPLQGGRRTRRADGSALSVWTQSNSQKRNAEMKKRYTIYLHKTLCGTVDVAANSLDEAKNAVDIQPVSIRQFHASCGGRFRRQVIVQADDYTCVRRHDSRRLPKNRFRSFRRDYIQHIGTDQSVKRIGSNAFQPISGSAGSMNMFIGTVDFRIEPGRLNSAGRCVHRGHIRTAAFCGNDAGPPVSAAIIQYFLLAFSKQISQTPAYLLSKWLN